MHIVSSAQHALHAPTTELEGGRLVTPYESVDRWHHVTAALSAPPFETPIEPDPLDMERVARVHDERYLEFLQTAWQEWVAAGYEGEAIPTVFPARRMRQIEPTHIDGRLGYHCMAMETSIVEGTWAAACSSAAVALHAQRLVAGGDQAFAMCRPPGHHAARDLYGGYCFLNNAAIAAQAFIDDGCGRVAVLDVDFHHGNGTQDIFYDRGDVFFASLHGEPAEAFPHFSGYADERGVGPGEGTTLNHPLPRGTRYGEWSSALEDSLDHVGDFGAEALVVSLGVDTFERDPISFFGLTSDDFADYGRRIARMDIPTLFVLEGGYAVAEIGLNVAAVLGGYLAEL